jgi:DNA-binding NtrC family response regulator
MPLSVQVKLLHFLEQGRFRRVGSTRDQTVDVRVIAATNRHLPQDVREGRFRADLFYRLNVVSLHILPLRERTDDIPALIEYFLTLYRQRFNRPALSLSAEALQRLQAFPWPGNIRELRNCLERAIALSPTDTIEAGQLMLGGDSGQASGIGTSPQPPAHGSQPATLYELERQHILRVLSEAGGNRERAAAILGISARTLYRKLREYETSAAPTGFSA